MTGVGLRNTQRRAACTDALALLSRHELGVAAAVISEFSNGHTIWSEGLSRLPGTEKVHISIGGAVAGLVGIEVGVVSGVFNLESPGVSALGWRLRHEEAYHSS